MPYTWTDNDTHIDLHLEPHQSLTPRGFVWFMGATCALISLPLFSLLGTATLWALLPFLAVAVGLQWGFLNRNKRDRSVHEHLRIDATTTELVRHNPRAADQSWDCNTYWVQVNMHDTNPRIPHYVTLTGNGREVELGAFLTEEERMSLKDELVARFSDLRRVPPSGPAAPHGGDQAS
ncbi:MAG: DUF2244 domain-containing protein [Pseudomonadota bacterium]